VICASRFLATRLPRQNTLVLPFVVKVSGPGWAGHANTEYPAQLQRRFIYAGSPGVGLSKDRLDYVISGFERIHQEGVDFRLLIVGLTLENYLEMCPRQKQALLEMEGKVTFTGRIPRPVVLSLLKSADFSVFFRKSNRVSNVGFPTKYVEAASLGVPVITNATSDLDLYLQDGVNGFMVPALDPDRIHDTLLMAATLDAGKLALIKQSCAADNPFKLSQWQEPMRQFLNQLRRPR